MSTALAPARDLNDLDVLFAEAEEFRREAARYVAGQVDEDAWRTYRLRRGIYGQRQEGFQMVRIKIPSGMATARQLRAIAETAETWGSGIGHITTRQDVQLHYVRLADVPAAMERLASDGLTTREACGNSVRNVTACPVAGHCPGQAFDVRPWSRAISKRLLRNPLGAALPRKFKIAFSCSTGDCALGDINDIGASATVHNGYEGFRIRIGGGLGPSPQLAETLYEFLPVEQLGEVADVILRVFDAHGNRQNKHKARMKFVLRERGIEWFRSEVDRLRAQFPSAPLEPQAVDASEGMPVPVTVPQGNLNAEQLRFLATTSELYGDGTIAFTIQQNLVINGVPENRQRALRRELEQNGYRVEGAGEFADVVTCPGAATCNLGITRSMDLGAELTRRLNDEEDPEVRQIIIRISGCPNSCGHHHVGQIGFFGNARKVEGESAPYYQLLIGGGQKEGRMRFGKAIAAIPARLAPETVERIVDFYKAERQAGEPFLDFVDRIGVERLRAEIRNQAEAVFDEMLVDWGEEEKFKLKLGKSECAT